MREGVSLAEALDAFLADCEIRGLSVSARRSYRIYLRNLTTFDSTSAREVIASYVRQGKVGSARVAWAALRSFGAYGQALGYWQNPTDHIPCPKPRKIPHRFLTHDQVKAVYAVAEEWDAVEERGPIVAPKQTAVRGYGARNRAVASNERLMHDAPVTPLLGAFISNDDTRKPPGPQPPPSYRLIVRLLLTGLRAAELLSIRWQDIHEDTIIIKGKGAKYRKIVVDAETCALLALQPRHAPLVFQMHYSTLQHRINALGRKAGIGWKINPHDFRRTTFTLAIKDGMDSQHLQTLGGWANSTMLRRYAESAMEDAALDAARRHGMASRVLG